MKYDIIILAAGMGSRLRPYTNDKPKCLVQIFDGTIFSNLMDKLSKHKNEINKVLIGVGFEKEKMINSANKYKDIFNIEFCHNDDYAKTNNIVSMKMALDSLKSSDNDIMLFESDLYVTDELIADVFKSNKKSFAVVSRYEYGMDGSCIVVKNDKITHMKHHSELKDSDIGYKTVNIYRFENAFIKNKFSPVLDAYCKMSENSYYELILNVLISTNMCSDDFDYLEVPYSVWHEIDNINDLMIAKYKFSVGKEKIDICAKQFGGYWNYDVVDFNLVCNSNNTNEDFFRDVTPIIGKLITTYPSNYNVIRQKAASYLNIADFEHISVGNGSCELINILKHKYQFSTISPCFGEYKVNKVFDIPLEKLENEKDIVDTSLKLFETMAKDSTNNCICIVNPNNPTSTLIEKKDIIKLLENNKNKFFVVDESFIDFTNDRMSFVQNETRMSVVLPDQKQSLIDVYEKYENLAIIKSMGKQYNIAGIRLGVMISKNKELNSYIKDQLPIWNINSIAEFYLENAFKYEKKFKLSLKELEKNKQYFISKLKEKGFDVIASKANFIFCKSKIKPDELKEKLIKNNIITKHIVDNNAFSFYRFNVVKKEEIDLFISSL